MTATQDQPSGGFTAAMLRGVERLFRPSQDTCPLTAASALFLEYRLPLGCLVHMTPVFEAIKRSRPEVSIAVATRGLGLEVLRHSPFVDHLIDTPDPTVDLYAAIRRLRSQLCANSLRPDCVLTGASDQRTRIALMAMLGTSGWRGGYTQSPQLYHQPLRYDAGRSLIANNLRLATMLRCDAEVTRPRVFFGKREVEKVTELLRLANPEGRNVAVFVTQNSGGQRTGWHAERFAAVIRHAAGKLGCAVVYVGTAAERESIEEVRAAAGGIGVSVAGKTTVSELAALAAMSDVMIALDTGTMHVGRAAGTPMVVLGPSWQRPVEWMPLGVENVRILRGEDIDSAPQGYLLDEISAEGVIAALDELMSACLPSAATREMRVSEGLSEIDHLAGR